MSGPALALDGVAVGYDGPPVLTGLSFEIARGELVGVLGPSGSGKTTLLRPAPTDADRAGADARRRAAPAR